MGLPVLLCTLYSVDGGAAVRTRIFIDFWNFQLGWKERAPAGVNCDWTLLPPTLVTAAGSLFVNVGQAAAPLQLEETLLYASVDPAAEGNLTKWLKNFIEPKPSWRVHIRERKPQPKSLHCRSCSTVTDKCPACGTPFVGKPEKGIDSRIVTDLLSLAWQDAYDVAILVSSDADFIPAVERIQEKGLKVVNAGWHNKGFDLKGACWANFSLDALIPGMRRP